jgi:hypothetical protein
MNTAEIVKGEVQGDSGPKMCELFRERIGEPRKTPHRHSHGQVLPFHNALTAKDRKEWRGAIRGFQRLIKTKAPMPQPKGHKTEAATQC